MAITQGTNIPITIYFRSGIPDFEYLEVNLSASGETLKHWSKEDLVFNENLISAPIEQSESVAWPKGPCLIEMKGLVDGSTVFYKKKKDKIMEWIDHTIMEEQEDPEDVDV